MVKTISYTKTPYHMTAAKHLDLARMSRDTGISKEDLQKIISGTYRSKQPAALTADATPPRPGAIETLSEILSRRRTRPTLSEISQATSSKKLASMLEQLDFTDLEFKAAYEKLTEIIRRETLSTNDVDELQKLLDSAPSGSSEETALIEKIVTLEIARTDAANDLDSLIEMYSDGGFFPKSKTYLWNKIIARAETPEEIVNLLDNEFPDGSREYYAALRRHDELMRQWIAECDDRDELIEGLDDLDQDDPLKPLMEERIVAITDDKSELVSIRDDGGYYGDLAEEKLAKIFADERTNATSASDLDDLCDDVEEGSTEDDLVELRLVELFKDADEASGYSLTKNSYAMYLLCKRFGNSAPTPSVPPAAIPRQDSQTEIDKRAEDEMASLESLLAKCTDPGHAIFICESQEKGSEQARTAYEKAAALLRRALRQATKEACIEYVRIFPAGSSEWIQSAKKLSEFYPKPWYQFW